MASISQKQIIDKIPHVLLSLKKTSADDEYIYFWGHDNRGYTFNLNDAGYYADDVIRADLEHYNNGDTIAVPTFCAEALSRDIKTCHCPTLSQGGAAIPNTKEKWSALLPYVIERPKNEPIPDIFKEEYTDNRAMRAEIVRLMMLVCSPHALRISPVKKTI